MNILLGKQCHFSKQSDQYSSKISHVALHTSSFSWQCSFLAEAKISVFSNSGLDWRNRLGNEKRLECLWVNMSLHPCWKGFYPNSFLKLEKCWNLVVQQVTWLEPSSVVVQQQQTNPLLPSKPLKKQVPKHNFGRQSWNHFA